MTDVLKELVDAGKAYKADCDQYGGVGLMQSKAAADAVVSALPILESLLSQEAELAKKLAAARAQLQEQHAVLMEALKVTEGHWDSHGGQYHCDACNLHHKLLRLKENEQLLARPYPEAP